MQFNRNIESAVFLFVGDAADFVCFSAGHPFIIVDAMYLKAREDHRVKSKALFLAIGVNNTGHKEVLGFEVYDSERANTWKDFFEGLKSRGLRGVNIVISDAHAGLVEARRLKESIYDEYQDVAAEVMSILDEGFEDSLTIMALPSKYRIALRTSNIIERENREIRRLY